MHGTKGRRKKPTGYLLTYLLTPWCRVLKKLTGLQLFKKFPAFHRTRMFITALTSVRQVSLSWASRIQSIYPHPTFWRSILILSTHLRLGLPWSHSLRFPHQDPIHAQPISTISDIINYILNWFYHCTIGCSIILTFIVNDMGSHRVHLVYVLHWPNDGCLTAETCSPDVIDISSMR